MNTMSMMGFDKLVSQLILGNLAADVDILDSETLLSELNMDEIEKASLAVNLEEQCAVEISDDSINDFQSVGDVVEYLEQNVASTKEKSLVSKQKKRLRKSMNNHYFSSVSDRQAPLFVEQKKRTGDFSVVATFERS